MSGVVKGMGGESLQIHLGPAHRDLSSRSGSVLPRKGECVSASSHMGIPGQVDTTGADGAPHVDGPASAPVERTSARTERCPWCDIFVRSAAGMCTCDEACGCLTCPARNADDYTPPPVPKFARAGRAA